MLGAEADAAVGEEAEPARRWPAGPLRRSPCARSLNAASATRLKSFALGRVTSVRSSSRLSAIIAPVETRGSKPRRPAPPGCW